MKYHSKPTECEAVQWIALPHSPEHGLLASANQIVAWVKANGGEAMYEELTKAPAEWDIKDRAPRIAVRTVNGWAYAAPGHYVVMGSAKYLLNYGGAGTHERRDFYPCDPETFESRWATAAEQSGEQP